MVTFIIVLLSLSLLFNVYLLMVNIRMGRIIVAQQGAINTIKTYMNFVNKVPREGIPEGGRVVN